MRVLVVARHYYRPGAMTGGHVHRQCVELNRLGVDVEVVCPLARFNVAIGGNRRREKILARSKSIVLDGLPITYIPYSNVPHRLSVDLDTASLSRAVSRAIETRNDGAPFDLVHAHRLFPDAWATLPVARRLGIPLLATAHGSDVHTNPLRNAGIARCTRQLIATTDKVSAVSQALAEQLLDFERPPRDVAVVYHGVDTDRFRVTNEQTVVRSKLGLPTRGLGICSVCRLVVEKGVRELLAAFETLSARRPEAWLLLVGDGPARRELEDQCRRAGLQDKVFFAGSCPNSQIPDWLAASDLFALPSYKEGLPNVVLEAMACALPIVATDVGGIAEAVRDDCALLVPPRDVSSLLEALDRLLGSAALRRRLGAAGLRRIEERFSWRRSALDLANVYEALLHERRETGEPQQLPLLREHSATVGPRDEANRPQNRVRPSAGLD